MKNNMVISKDHTKIAFEKTGQGPPVILVDGALVYRGFHGGKDLADKLAKSFTVYIYDRRGRGESTDTLPYAVDREIEDIEALVDKAGGSAYLYGISSGAALALLAAVKLGSTKVKKLALYEPPYNSDNNAIQDFAHERKKMDHLLRASKRSDAVVSFVSRVGVPPQVIEGMKQTPDWKVMESVAHTLAYDYAILGDGAVPFDLAKALTIPNLVMDGEKSLVFMHETADALAKVIPNAERKTLKDQTHEVSSEAIAPVLADFFNSKEDNEIANMQKITPSLWFDTNCEEAMNFYIDVFNRSPHKNKESEIIFIKRYEKGMETPGNMEGKILTGIFELAGQRFMALDGGPIFKFNESISFYVECEDQKEVDYFWERLSAVPESEVCGWLKDKFGLSWQIIPKKLGELISDPDKEKSLRVTNAMLKMKKIVIADLEKAYKG